MSTEIVGPFKRYVLVVDGWSVPFVEAREIDGGKINWTVDQRLGFTTSAADFDQTARLVAHAVAVAAGLPSHPRGDLTDEERAHYFRHVQHTKLAPSRLVGLDFANSEDSDDD